VVTPESPVSVLVVDDDAGVRQSLRLCLEVDGARVLGVGSGKAALEALERARFDVVLLDLWLGSDSGIDAIPDMLRRQPAVAIIVITAFATFESAVLAMKRGAKDYLPKPFTPEQVRLAVQRAHEATRLRRELRDAEDRLKEAGADDDFFASESPAFRTVMKQAARVAAADAPVLLRGESGTGKNVTARWLWQHGPRAGGPFVAVNCPALSRDLMNSTLFGHKRGAFTGATHDAPGKVQEAEGGVLFLDEVGELSPEAQASLLRFLNDRTYERVGDPTERRADVRLVTATNRHIEDEVKVGRFREDLFFRLNVVSLVLTPLRGRPEDVLALTGHYLASAKQRVHRPGLELSEASAQAIREHRWPGNLRELRNAVERGVILATTESIEPDDLGILPQAEEAAPAGTGVPVALGAEVKLAAIEREHIARVVARAPTLEVAAETLGIDVSTLQRKRKRYGLQ
jgi:NtrC-family two-component system response regulator AlgB